MLSSSASTAHKKKTNYIRFRHQQLLCITLHCPHFYRPSEPFSGETTLQHRPWNITRMTRVVFDFLSKRITMNPYLFTIVVCLLLYFRSLPRGMSKWWVSIINWRLNSASHVSPPPPAVRRLSAGTQSLIKFYDRSFMRLKWQGAKLNFITFRIFSVLLLSSSIHGFSAE